MRKWVLFIFCFFLTKLSAQDFLTLQYTMQDGLPSNTIYGATQDKYGHIWLSTSGGASRFDGSKFTNFTPADGLTDLDVIDIFSDSKGVLWMCTFNGKPCCFANGHFINPDNTPALARLKSSSTINTISEDPNGNKWIFTHSDIFVLNADSPESQQITRTFDKSNLNNSVKLATLQNRVCLAGATRLFDAYTQQVLLSYPTVVGTMHHNIAPRPNHSGMVLRDSLGIFEITDQITLKRLQSYSDLSLDRTEIKRIIAFEQEYWLTLKDGGILQVLPNGTTRKVLSDVIVNDIDRDRDGNYWLSTMSGLYLLPVYFDQTRVLTTSQQLPSNKVTALEMDKSQRLWLGFDGATMAIMEGKSIKSQQIKGAPRVLQVSQFVNYRDGMLVALRDNGLYEVNKSMATVQAFKNNQDKYDFYPRSLILTPEGLPSFIQVSQLATYNPTTHFFDFTYDNPQKKRLFLQYRDQQRRLWISKSNGLSYLENEEEHELPSDQFPLFKEEMTCMMDAGNGQILLSPKGYGLCMWNGSQLSPPLTAAQNLPGNYCKRLIAHRGEIWAVCSNGVAEIGIDHNQPYVKRYFDQSNSILSGQVNDLAIDEHHIYIATDVGLITLDRNIQLTRVSAPKITLVSIVTHTEQLTDQDNPGIHGNSLPIQVQFRNFAYPQDRLIEYQYRLHDTDEWINTANTSLEITDLKSGNYTLQLRARRPNTEWGPVTSWRFVVINPFYKETRFRIIVGLLLITTVFAAFWWYASSKARAKRLVLEQELMVNKLENQALQSVMHPHFMFNALNSIQHFLNDNDRLQANRYLSRFAKLMRINLSAGIQGYLSLEEETERLKHYIGLEALRLENVFEYQIVTDPELQPGAVFIPAMIIQPYIENALWHGLAPAEKEGLLSIHFVKINPFTLEIRIEDNGIGLANSRLRKRADGHRSQALDIIRKRLELLSRQFKMYCHVTMQPLHPEVEERPGNVVIIQLPLVGREELDRL